MPKYSLQMISQRGETFFAIIAVTKQGRKIVSEHIVKELRQCKNDKQAQAEFRKFRNSL